MSATAHPTRSPQLDTIRMVEDFVREHSGEYKRKALWKALPRGMMYQTFRQIIEYLQESAKVGIDAEGKVCWVHNPALYREYIGRDDLRIA